ncbi:MAG: Ig-like domain-containing protein [Blastocatellia bacterium]|nr:Ig-like domain-containing protein [Blastocatellia bacterium]
MITMSNYRKPAFFLLVTIAVAAAAYFMPSVLARMDGDKLRAGKRVGERAKALAERARESRERKPGGERAKRNGAVGASMAGLADRVEGPAAAPQIGDNFDARALRHLLTQGVLGEKVEDPFDEPREALTFFLKKRLPEGEKEFPVEKIFEAQRRMEGMSYFSTSQDRMLSGAERVSLRMRGAAAGPEAATWSPLGPGNIGGRTRALLVNPQTPSVMYAAGVSGGVWKTTNGGQAWTPISDTLATLTVSSMAFETGNPNTIYVGTGEGVFVGEQDTLGDFRGAGIFKTTDAGATWTRLESTKTEDFYFVNDLVVSPNDKNRIYAATRTGIWRSSDAGLTWTRSLEALNDSGDAVTGGCLDLAIRTDKMTDSIFGSCGTFEAATIYRNTDAGGSGTWTAVLTEPEMGRTSLAIAPSNQDIVYALASSIEPGAFELGLHAVFRSTAGGDKDSWTAQVRNTSPTKLNTLLLSNPLIATLTDCQFDLSDDFFNQGWYDNVIAVDPVDPNRVWVGGIDLFRSDDGGANWGVASYWWLESPGTVKTSPYAHADHHAIVFHPQYNGTSNQTVFLGSDGGLFRSENARGAVAMGTKGTCASVANAVNWTPLNNNYGVTQFYHGSVSPDGKSYYGGTQDNGTLLGTDATGVNAWKSINGGDGGYTAFDFTNPDTLFASFTDISFVKSTDGGKTFGSATAGINDGGLFITPYAVDPSDPQRMWTGGDFIWRTFNGAARWVRASTITAGITRVSAIAIAPTDSNKVLVGMGDGYIHRIDSALTATSATTWPSIRPRRGWVSSLAIDPNNKNLAYATYSTFGGVHVHRTTDGGETWTGLDGVGTGALPDIPVHCLAIDPSNSSRLYIGTDVGVFVSNDQGTNWAVENTGFVNAITETLQIHGLNGVTTLYGFTHGRGAWRVVLNNTGCSYGLSPRTITPGADASNGTVAVTAQPGACSWTASSNASWLKVQGGGAGSGSVGYTLEANDTFASRTGTATIAGRTFTVTQPGRVDVDSPEVAITEPSAPPIVVDTTGAINLAGTAKDNNAVTRVSWATDRGVIGTAAFTASTGRWVAQGIPLAAGANTITITAADAAGNLGRVIFTTASKPPASMITVVGTGARGATGDNGLGVLATVSRAIRVALDGAGNLYLTDSDNHTIRKVTPAGVITTVVGKSEQRGFGGDGGPATQGMLSFPIGIAVDGAGNLYICDNTNVRIRKVTAATGVISTIAGSGVTGFSGDGGPAIEARLSNPQSVAVDKDGNVYIADSGNNRIRKVAASDGKISTVAGNGTAAFGGDNGPAVDAQLSTPLDVVADKDGNLIICDAGNNRLRKVTAADGKIATIAGSDTVAGFAGDGGPAINAKLFAPVGGVIDAAGNIYFSDRGNHRVRKVDTAGIITSLAGTGTAAYNGDGLGALVSALSAPTGLAVDSVGNVYIGDRDNRRVRKIVVAGANDTVLPTIAIASPTSAATFATNSGQINVSGTASDNGGVLLVRWSNDRGGSGVALGTTSWSIQGVNLQAGLNNLTVTAWDASGNAASATLGISFTPEQVIYGWAGAGQPGDSGDGGAAATARLSPFGLAFTGGSLYVTDDESHRVRRITPAGLIGPFAGTGALGASGDGAAALDASMNSPSDIVADAAGNLYIADSNNHRVRRVGTDGKITTIAGTGEADFGGDGGPATQAKLARPIGLAIDPAGNLLIADSNNARIRKVTLSTGIITTIAGTGAVDSGGDGGPALQAFFKFPYGLAVDRAGVIYVLDRLDHRIRRIGTDGVITTIAGTGEDGYNGDARPAREAQINFGSLMTVDAQDNLLFADFGNNRIRKITISTGIITTVAGSGLSGSTGDGGDPLLAPILLPTDVAVDPAGNLYVADWGGYRIRKIQATSGLRTVAGVSAASFLGAQIAPESIVAGFGANLAGSVQVVTTLPLPTTLNGTTIRVRDAVGVERLSPIFFVAPTQVNFQIPPSTANGTATITITAADGSTSTGLVNIANAAPGLFSANADGQGVASAVVLRVRANGEQVYESVARLDSATGKFVPVPIDLGPETDQLFLIAFGTGVRFRSSLGASSATIGGANAELLYAGSQGGFVGLDQNNIRIPRSLAGRGEVDVKVVLDGVMSNVVKIAIK